MFLNYLEKLDIEFYYYIYYYNNIYNNKINNRKNFLSITHYLLNPKGLDFVELYHSKNLPVIFE